MNLLLKFLILVLTFQFVLGDNNLYAEEKKQKRIEEVRRKQQEASGRTLLEVCSIGNNYEAPDCLSLRRNDAEVTKNQRLEAEKQSSYKRQCEGNPYDFYCLDKFGFPNTFLGWIFRIASWVCNAIGASIVIFPVVGVIFFFFSNL